MECKAKSCRLVIITAVLLLGMGCASLPYQKAYTGDGTLAMRVKCDGTGATRHDCLQKFGELCGQSGFQIMGAAGEKSAFAAATSNVAYAGNVERRSLIGRCKGNDIKKINQVMLRRADAANANVRAGNLWIAVPMLTVGSLGSIYAYETRSGIGVFAGALAATGAGLTLRALLQ